MVVGVGVAWGGPIINAISFTMGVSASASISLALARQKTDYKKIYIPFLKLQQNIKKYKNIYLSTISKIQDFQRQIQKYCPLGRDNILLAA